MKIDVDDERAAITGWNSGNRRAGDRLVQMHMGMIVNLVAPFRTDRVLLEDLVQEGAMALLRTARTYDEAKGRFGAHAYTSIVRAAAKYRRRTNTDLSAGAPTQQAASVLAEEDHRGGPVARAEPLKAKIARTIELRAEELRGLRRPALRIDMPVGESTTTTLGDRLTGGELGADEELDQLREIEAITEAIRGLHGRQREVLERHYLSDPAETLDAIGKSWGRTKERARQVKGTALAVLRNRLNRTPIKDQSHAQVDD